MKYMKLALTVDDLKVPHMELLELKKFGQYLRDNFGEALTEHTCDIHNYLGINLDFLGKGKLRVSMIKYLHKFLTGFLEYQLLGNRAASPTRDHLFEIRDEKEANYLLEEMAQEFRHVVVQLLFLCNCDLQDIQTVDAFLMTRVKKPNRDDWGKLRRVLTYLKSTKYMKLTLTVDDLLVIRW